MTPDDIRDSAEYVLNREGKAEQDNFAMMPHHLGIVIEYALNLADLSEEDTRMMPSDPADEMLERAEAEYSGFKIVNAQGEEISPSVMFLRNYYTIFYKLERSKLLADNPEP